MSGELKMENGELKTPADMRDALLLVAYTAKDALYTPYPTAEAAAKAYADAIDLIRKSVCPKTFFTPAPPPAPPPAAADEKRDFRLKPVKTFVKLPRLLAFKVELPRADGTRRTIGAWCRRNESDDEEEFEIVCDKKLVAYGCIHVGHSSAIKMVKGMAYELVTAKQHATRNRLNRKARKNGECGGAE